MHVTTRPGNGSNKGMVLWAFPPQFRECDVQARCHVRFDGEAAICRNARICWLWACDLSRSVCGHLLHRWGRCFGLKCAPVPQRQFRLDSRAALLSLRNVGQNVGAICVVIFQRTDILRYYRKKWMPREDHNYLPLYSATFQLNHANAIVCGMAVPHLAVDVRQKPQ